jgi:hypothetical protein
MRPNAAGLSNTDAMRRMIRIWVGMPEPVSLVDTGSGSDQVDIPRTWAPDGWKRG